MNLAHTVLVCGEFITYGLYALLIKLRSLCGDTDLPDVIWSGVVTICNALPLQHGSVVVGKVGFNITSGLSEVLSTDLIFMVRCGHNL
jgi:hypothetical protein